MAEPIPKVTSNNGRQIPVLGLGTWKSKASEVTRAVRDALDIGYRHIDCAFVYQNEREVGDGLVSKMAEGVVKREDVWITSKLWNTYHDPKLVEEGPRKSLTNLEVSYLDLYLIHRPQAYQSGEMIFSEVDYVQTWKAMEECFRKGLTRSIGLSNFNSRQVERIMQVATIKPVANQVECHPYLAQNKLKRFCSERGIHLIAYSPLGSPDQHRGDPDLPPVLQDPKVKSISAKHGKTPAQVLLRYQIQNGNIVIPKSVTKERTQQNAEVFDFELTPNDVAALDGLDRKQRMVRSKTAESHKYYPFHEDY